MESIKLIFEALSPFADKHGINSAILVLMLIGGWRLFKNHLFHISNSISNIDKKVTCIDTKLSHLKKTVAKIDKRLAVREGLCDERHPKK